MRIQGILFATLVLTGCATTSFGSGYRIPEQSINSLALGNAYVANANQADAAYFNPANMSWLDQSTLFEGGLTYIHLTSISYDDFRTPAYSGDSEDENFFIPNIYLVSPDFNNFRFGFALTFPAGLSKRWNDPFPRTFAEEFSMTVAEANPTVSYKIGDMVSLAAGVRFIYSEATVKSRGMISAGGGEYVNLSREMDGDTFEYAYNLALTVRPTDKLSFAATYRSEVDLDLEGDGKLYSSTSFPNSIIPAGAYVGDGAVSVPLPAILSLAASYTFAKSTLEFEYDRTFWSAYETLDFSYPVSLRHPILIGAFDTPLTKDWDDVDAFRLGYTYQWDENLALMGAVGLDGNPIPDASLSFDLPDSDAWLVAMGFRYKVGEKLSVGAAYLFEKKEDRTVRNRSLNGEFTGSSVHLFSLSASYFF